jgi:hypothetical protein
MTGQTRGVTGRKYDPIPPSLRTRQPAGDSPQITGSTEAVKRLVTSWQDGEMNDIAF